MPDTPTSATPLEGKTTIDEKMFFEPERLSYQSAVAIADAIASAVKPEVVGKTVVIAGTQLLTDLANLRATYSTLDSLTRDYASVAELGKKVLERRLQPITDPVPIASADALVGAALTGVIAPATALITAAVGLISLFREDVEYHGAKALVDTLAFEIALASQLIENEARAVIIPDLKVDLNTSTGADSLSFRLAKVQAAKGEAWAVIGPMISELVQLEAELEKAGRENNQPEFDRISEVVSDLRRDMQPISDPLSRSDQRLSDLQNQWNRRDETSGLAELARLLRAECIFELKPTYLHAKVISSGGHHRISRSLLRTLFVGDGLSFAGGAIARWAFLGESGSVTKGGILVRRATGSFRPWFG